MIIARIAEYLDFKGIATYKAEENSGISNGTLSKAIREKTSIRTDILDKFLKYHGDISPEWLLTGKCSMLRDVQPTTPTQSLLYRGNIPTPSYSQKIPSSKLLFQISSKIKITCKKPSRISKNKFHFFTT
ncbi:MAG: helix-turn-helix domain-containing protein [Chitinophagaceae bacterium]